MNRKTIKEVLEEESLLLQEVEIAGWVRSFRSNRFVIINDGSTTRNLQVVIDPENIGSDVSDKISTGAAVRVVGSVEKSEGAGQAIEIKSISFTIVGEADSTKYPIQPKKHSLEFLRSVAHLRPRTQTFASVTTLRHHLAMGIHQYFDERNYYYIHTPVITGMDAEGAGETFTVTNLDLDKGLPLTEDKKVDYDQDFFGKKVSLTVSGQLEVEAYALSMGRTYTFGPTFRAENSNTSRHLAEFWMVEPEVAFFNIDDNMDLAEDLLQNVITYVMNKCPNAIDFLDQRLQKEDSQKPKDQRNPMGLRERLEFVTNNSFQRLSYTEAIQILENSRPFKKRKFTYPVEWGIDLQSEHERYLVEKHFECPVVLFDYPAQIKAFYMRMNDDNKTVRAMDVLFPGIGEIVGGSQREERLSYLQKRMKEMDIDQSHMEWYLDTRRYGTAPHSGFGLGFDRLMLFVSGMNNVRDVIPFPRTPRNAEF